MNFVVVGGAEQPSNPKENTIWVKTETAIPEYVLSPFSQTKVLEGRVWIQTASAGDVVFDAIKENILTVIIVKAYQCVKGVYKPVTASIYQSEKWTQFSSETRYLYNAGDECTDITGGWQAYAYRSANSQSTAQAPTVNKYAASMKISMDMGSSTYYGGALFTENSIDMSGYTKLVIDVYAITGQLKFRVAAAKENGYTIAAGKVVSATGETSIDISSLSSGYIALAIEGASCSVQFRQVRLE